jgi:hypothetical protein
MWILPPLELHYKQPSFRLPPVYQSVFPFTHHRITLAVYRHRAPKQIAPQQQWFVSTKDTPMPSPHRRALDLLLRRKDNF